MKWLSEARESEILYRNRPIQRACEVLNQYDNADQNVIVVNNT